MVASAAATETGFPPKVLACAPGGQVMISARETVAESGISSPTLAGRLGAAGFDAILVGEALVTADDPGATLQALRSAAAASPDTTRPARSSAR